jgi:hypothetical protein
MHLPSYTTLHFKKYYIIFTAMAVKPHFTILLPQQTFHHRISFHHFTISHAHTLFEGTLQKKPTLRQGANVLIFDGKV